MEGKRKKKVPKFSLFIQSPDMGPSCLLVLALIVSFNRMIEKGAQLVPIRTGHTLDKLEAALRNFEGKCLKGLFFFFLSHIIFVRIYF